MRHDLEPLNTLQEIKIAWINLADNYKSVGQSELAFEVLKTLDYYSGKGLSLETLRDIYHEKLLEWEFFHHWVTFRSAYTSHKTYFN